MRSRTSLIRRATPRLWAILAVLAGATIAGCATPGGGGLADFKSRRQIEAIAADDSFPSAAEAGLSSASKSDTKQR